MKPHLFVEFNEAHYGFWNGGAKWGGTFKPVRMLGGLVKWECFALNYWFTESYGGSWKKAVSIAHRVLKRKIRTANSIKTIWA